MKRSLFRVAGAPLVPRRFQERSRLGLCPLSLDRTRPQRSTVEGNQYLIAPQPPAARETEFRGRAFPNRVWVAEAQLEPRGLQERFPSGAISGFLGPHAAPENEGLRGSMFKIAPATRRFLKVHSA